MWYAEIIEILSLHFGSTTNVGVCAVNRYFNDNIKHLWRMLRCILFYYQSSVREPSVSWIPIHIKVTCKKYVWETMLSVSEIYVRQLCERFWKRLSNCVQRWYKGGCYKTPVGQTVVPATHIICPAVARLFTESHEAISHTLQTQSAISFEFTFCKRNIFMWMGFLEKLILEAPALIEKNKPKRILHKCIWLSLGMPALRAHPNIWRRTIFPIFVFCDILSVSGF